MPIAGTQVHEHETQPPGRYTEGSLVKELEELGIGRPSTYASIIDTLQQRCGRCHCRAHVAPLVGRHTSPEVFWHSSRQLQWPIAHTCWSDIQSIKSLRSQHCEHGLHCREYVVKHSSSLVPTTKGRLLASFLNHYFPAWVDYQFSSTMEDTLDQISAGDATSQGTLDGFWGKVQADVQAVQDVGVAEVRLCSWAVWTWVCARRAGAP